MSSLDARTVKASLIKKGFAVREGDHTFFTLLKDGAKTSIRTKVSHGEVEIGEPLIRKMSAQVHLSKADFLDLIRCPLSKEAYLEKVSADGCIK